jgi:hypothetical protein
MDIERRSGDVSSEKLCGVYLFEQFGKFIRVITFYGSFSYLRLIS